jgi:SAM-dependent methyltransferase
VLNRILEVMTPASVRRARERELRRTVRDELLETLRSQHLLQSPESMRDAIATETREAVRHEWEQHADELSSPLLASAALQETIRGIVRAELSSDAFAETVKEVVEQRGPRTETLRLVDEGRNDLLRLELQTRRVLCQTLWQMVPPPPQKALTAEPQDFSELLAALQRLHPGLYPAWERINFSETPAEFARRPEGSCTLGKRATDLPFSGFVAPYLKGRVLDVGCGPYAIPLYLQGYPLELLYGIDPLEPFEPHPFTFARTFAEFIPFSDHAFETVIAATSLDHTLSLKRALAEIRRVLAPGGHFLIWDGFVKGAPPYDPDDSGLQPVDSYHFFHFDEPWFEELMRSCGFAVREKLAFDPSPHAPQYCTSFFYCLSVPEGDASPAE